MFAGNHLMAYIHRQQQQQQQRNKVNKMKKEANKKADVFFRLFIFNLSIFRGKTDRNTHVKKIVLNDADA